MTLDERIDGALKVALNYASIDGAHHKQWAIDQMVRALTGCTAVDDYYQDNAADYDRFIAEHNAGEDGPDTYSWDEGIAP